MELPFQGGKYRRPWMAGQVENLGLTGRKSIIHGTNDELVVF